MKNTEKTTIGQGLASAVKKALSLLLAMVMLLSITAGIDLSAYAATSGDYEYEILDDGTVEITGYNGSDSLLSIPSTINGKKITSIGDSAFERCENLVSVTIPNGVTIINAYAFFACNNLASISIPDSVISIGKQAISGCDNLNFITIPNSVTTINEYAFFDCDHLMSINIPSSVTSIENGAFAGCSDLEIITVDKNNKIYDSRDNCNAIIETEYNYLISGCKNTKIPNTVESIGCQAFMDCENLTSIVIPNSVTHIDAWAFSGCSSLTSITIPNSVTSIGYGAFSGCENLTDITIPDSVETISSQAFEYTGYYNNKNNWQNNVLYIGNHLIKAENTISGDYTVNKGTVNIADEAFKECKKLTSVTMSSGIINIGTEAFMDCTRLMSVTIPNSVTKINYGTFMNCENLVQVTIPNSATHIGYYAFCNCKNLTNVTISTGVKNIYSSAFSNCTNLKSIVIPNSVDTIYSYAFSDCTNLKNITISSGVNTIDYDAFNNCISLENITIPTSVEEILFDAFEGCTNLTEITILNKDIDLSFDSIPLTTTIYGYKGSTAETYAKENGNKFIALECSHTWDNGKVTKAATCTATGVKTYTCTKCKTTKAETIKATGHNYKTTVTKATTSKNGSSVTKCTSCGTVSKKSTIAYPKTVTLSATSYTYDGKAKKPTVTVKDNAGKTIAASNYTVAYSNNTNVGTATVKVTFKGNYSGTVSKTFKINPKNTSISSVSALYKGFTVKYAKQATQTTGYQVQYSTSSNFSNAKTVTVNKNSTVVKNVTGLTAKKKYYVRIRTYKTVGKTNYYSAWSGSKNVTTSSYPTGISLSATSYTYDGKVKKPSVTVKHGPNKIASKYYTVSYSKGRKNVGTYTVTIKFKKPYSGTVKKTFKINPKNTSISSLSAQSKAFTVKLKKYTTQTTGYQIQYSTSSNFSNAKTVTVKNKTTSKKISKLTGKKKYYVRVRTYKTVGKTNYYSGWTKAKTVTTKK